MSVRCPSCRRAYEPVYPQTVTGFPCPCGGWVDPVDGWVEPLDDAPAAAADGGLGGLEPVHDDGLGGLQPVHDEGLGGLEPAHDDGLGGLEPVDDGLVLDVAPRAGPPLPPLPDALIPMGAAPRPAFVTPAVEPKRGLLQALAFPFTAPLPFFMFVALVGAVGIFRGFSRLSILFYLFGLYWYGLHAISTTADGGTRLTRPEFRERSDIWIPGVCGILAAILPAIPLVVALVLAPTKIAEGGPIAVLLAPTEEPTPALGDVEVPDLAASADIPVEMQDEAVPEDLRRQVARTKSLGRPGTLIRQPPEPKSVSVGVKVAAVAGWLSSVVLTPAFLLVAAMTRNIWSVLIPVNAVLYIGRMGLPYLRATLAFAVLHEGAGVLEWLLEGVPLGVRLIGPLLDGYVMVAGGAILGFAAHERRHELGIS